jgi:hypothetical protein
MKDYTSILSEKINNELQTINLNEADILQQTAKAIKILECGFSQLKAFITNYTFKDKVEEISFFKEVKPKLFSKLLYFHKIHGIAMRRPAESSDVTTKYLLNKLNRINDFFDRNLEFYEYYRSGNIQLDKYYFLRGKPDIWLNTDSFCFELDPRFSSCFDFKVAKVLANDVLAIYLNSEIKKMNSNYDAETIFGSFPKVKHTWTGTKTELVELIYGLYTRKSINHGNIDIKELVDYFCNVFNTDAGKFYRIYLNIRNRKDSRTLYLDSLRESLIRKMDEDDSK